VERRIELPAPTIVAALERELRPLRKKIGARAIYLVTGMGREMVETRLGGFLRRLRPGLLVLTGFAGGLKPELASGELVLAEEVLRPGGEGIRVDGRLLAEAAQALGDIQRGRLLTVARPASCEEKNLLGKDFSALAVDMESWWAAALAKEAGVPFLCLKAILDPQDKPLPRFIAGVDRRGRPTPKAWLTLMRHPWELVELLWWSQAAQRASGALALALSRLVEHLAPQEEAVRWVSS